MLGELGEVHIKEIVVSENGTLEIIEKTTASIEVIKEVVNINFGYTPTDLEVTQILNEVKKMNINSTSLYGFEITVGTVCDAVSELKR